MCSAKQTIALRLNSLHTVQFHEYEVKCVNLPYHEMPIKT